MGQSFLEVHVAYAYLKNDIMVCHKWQFFMCHLKHVKPTSDCYRLWILITYLYRFQKNIYQSSAEQKRWTHGWNIPMPIPWKPAKMFRLMCRQHAFTQTYPVKILFLQCIQFIYTEQYLLCHRNLLWPQKKQTVRVFFSTLFNCLFPLQKAVTY